MIEDVKAAFSAVGGKKQALPSSPRIAGIINDVPASLRFMTTIS